MKMANYFLYTALSLGLILSPIASVGAKAAEKEAVSPQKARVGTGTTAGQTGEGSVLTTGGILTGIAAAALLAVVIEAATGGKKDKGVTPPPSDPGSTTTTPATTTTTPATTTTTPTTTTSTGTGN
jgi:hypothetical protein